LTNYNLAAYCTSKGAIVELTRQVAVDYGKDKIHVNAICPGIIETAMVKQFTESTEAQKKVLGLHPWGKFGRPEDVGKVAVFLASSDAAFVTGTLLPVDGGFVAE
jgi:NAD(P)-dependent dehydrogenase (short-subunit alcohol dehydrogenase family)